MTDTEKVRHDAVLTFPFATHILTPSCFKKNIGKKEINYHSYNELAYLIDKYFRPDPGIYNMLKINTNERYMIVRYVSHSAVHDIGVKGMSIETKIKAVQEFSKYVKVFVSSETELPDALKPYRIPIPPERMHHALFYAELLYGESATMSSECAVLGTPAVSIDDVGRGYTDEQEKKYGLVFNFSTSRAEQEKSIHKSIELLKRSDLKTESKCKRETMLAEKIDLTSFLVWFVENYPESVKTMKDTPDYQQRFK
ncbi:MAG: hypothetical protein K8R67_15230 [Desulfobacteraceae bacterium]|nr:hypothetical protein [Desulfobacteraceae bacterium]